MKDSNSGFECFDMQALTRGTRYTSGFAVRWPLTPSSKEQGYLLSDRRTPDPRERTDQLHLLWAYATKKAFRPPVRHDGNEPLSTIDSRTMASGQVEKNGQDALGSHAASDACL